MGGQSRATTIFLPGKSPNNHHRGGWVASSITKLSQSHTYNMYGTEFSGFS